jgi:hypothetical protein
MAGCNVTLGIHFGTRRSHLATEPTLRIVSNPKKHTLRLIEGNNAARAAHPVDSRIRDFLAGDNDGSELFAALYGHIGREPIPERLRLATLLAPNQERVSTLAKLA